MKSLSRTMIRVISVVAVLAVVVAVALYVFSGDSSRKLTARFASGVGVYPGTPVKILGIQVGSVTKVTPTGGYVKIDMKIDKKYKVPADASSLLVANSLVSDRFVQLAPVYKGGPVMPDGATIPLNRTASPAELDDIYSALNQLSVALGPKGANKTGALSNLINVGAANLNGNGAALNESIHNLSQAATTLANGRGDLFGTVENLNAFTKALSASDVQVRHFNEQLAQVAGDLADERGDLGAALHNITIALHDVANFVKANAGKVHVDVVGLKAITGLLVKDQATLNEIFSVAPFALSNLAHGYQESTGTLGTRSNLANLTDLPGQICDLLDATFNSPLGKLLLGGLPIAGITSACASIAKAPASGLPTIPGVGG